MKFIIALLGFITSLSLFANPLKGKIIITGSSTVAPLANEIAQNFEKLHPNVRVDVQTGGSSRGIADTRQNVADIGLVSRALKDKEKDLIPHTIAKDGLTIILHKSNPIQNLSKQQVIDIYLGKITNWQQVGGLDNKIIVVNKAEGRSTLELFLKYFNLKNSQIKPHIIIGDNEQGIKTVSGNPHAIGYVSVGAAEYSAKAQIPIKLLPMNHVKASIETVEDGTFPLSRDLNLITLKGKKQNSLVREFLKYAKSKQVHGLIKGQYFVPVTQ